MGRPNKVLERLVVIRAGGRREYCRFPVNVAELPFEIDHIIAEKHHGLTVSENLAWACLSCNSHKGPNIAGIDPITSEIARLFHPRDDVWDEHFEWNGAWLRGLTSMGRATIDVLEINCSDEVAVRESLLDEGFVF